VNREPSRLRIFLHHFFLSTPENRRACQWVKFASYRVFEHSAVTGGSSADERDTLTIISLIGDHRDVFAPGTSRSRIFIAVSRHSKKMPHGSQEDVNVNAANS